MVNLINYCKNNNGNLLDCINVIQAQTQTGGMVAILHLIKGCLYHILKKPKYYNQMWYKNKYDFILESSRFGNALTFVTITKKDEIMNIGGNKCIIPKGTRLSMLHMNRCFDSKIFGKNNINVNEFNSKRDGLKEVTSWNAPEKLWQNKNKLYKNSKRFCPAHDIGIFVAEMVVQYYVNQILSATN